MLKVNKLKAKIIERDYTVDAFSKKIGIDKATFYRKMNNNTFLTKEVTAIAEALSLTHDELNDIFFA